MKNVYCCYFSETVTNELGLFCVVKKMPGSSHILLDQYCLRNRCMAVEYCQRIVYAMVAKWLTLPSLLVLYTKRLMAVSLY